MQNAKLWEKMMKKSKKGCDLMQVENIFYKDMQTKISIDSRRSYRGCYRKLKTALLTEPTKTSWFQRFFWTAGVGHF